AVPAMVQAFSCLHSGWMAASVAILLSPMNFLSPPIREDQVVQWNPWEPSGNFQFRPWKKRAHISHAEIGDRNYLLGNLQHAPELSRFEDTHPSDADAFAASRQPQILNGAAGAIDIGLTNRVPSQDVRSIARRIAGNAEIDRRIQNAFELQLRVEFAFLSFENFAGGCIG